MQLHSPLEVLSNSLSHAAFVALPELVYETRDNNAFYALSTKERQALSEREAKGESVMPKKQVRRRPEVHECSVAAMFPQTWCSTALGFGGIGGQAFTTAYTTVIEGPAGHRAVYWQGRLAYVIDVAKVSKMQAATFNADLALGNTVNVVEAVSRYGAPPR